jgi:putative copper export protein
MYFLLLAMRVLHILGAAIIVGGLIYLRFVVPPAPTVASADALFGGRRARWAMAVGLATLFLLVSGIFNYLYWHTTHELPPRYHMLFGIKFLLAVALFFIAAILAGRTTLAERFRQNMGLWLNLAIALSLAILIVAAIMRTYERPPKSADEIRMAVSAERATA